LKPGDFKLRGNQDITVVVQRLKPGVFELRVNCWHSTCSQPRQGGGRGHASLLALKDLPIRAGVRDVDLHQRDLQRLEEAAVAAELALEAARVERELVEARCSAAGCIRKANIETGFFTRYVIGYGFERL
jgi:hypothetical protein